MQILSIQKIRISRIKCEDKNYFEFVLEIGPYSLEHTIASQLVHDERGLHLAGLLVCVGHQATDKVGLARVKCAV